MSEATAAEMPSDFRPLPLLRNPHVQTLLGHFLTGPALPGRARAQVLRLPDGDALALHDSVPSGWQLGDPLAVVVHGLSGCHASATVQRISRRLLARRVRTVRLDLRGAGLALPLSRRGYHGGVSDDLRAALLEVHRWSPTSPLLLAGVSLGGNISLKLAGESADEPLHGLTRLAALGPPIDLERCINLLEQPGKRLYQVFFLRELVAQARQRQRSFPDLPPLRLPAQLTLRLFDELYTAPRWGFAGALDYYRRASAWPVMHRIRVPTLVLTARDDPFIAVEPFEDFRSSEHIAVRILPHGGHLGFLGWDGAGGIRWAERQVVDWLLDGDDRTPQAPRASKG
jgi:predicted alpha/beta-fold hydrolase